MIAAFLCFFRLELTARHDRFQPKIARDSLLRGWPPDMGLKRISSEGSLSPTHLAVVTTVVTGFLVHREIA